MEKKLPIFIILIIAFNNLLFAQNAVTIDVAIKNTAIYLINKLSVNTNIAILNINSENEALSNYIIDEIINLIVNDGTHMVVERKDIEKIQMEMDFQLSGEVSDESAQSIGKKLGAQTIIFGSMYQFGSNYRLSIRAISVETAGIQGSNNVNVLIDSSLLSIIKPKNKSIRGIFSVLGGGIFQVNKHYTNWETFDIWTGYYSDTLIGGGITVGLDLKYVELGISWIGMGDHTSKTYNEDLINHISTEEYRNWGKSNYFGFNIFLKYPFNILNKINIFPLAGYEFQSIFYQWFRFGAGLDYLLKYPFFIRGEILYGLKFLNIDQRNELKNGKEKNDQFTTVQHGPSIKIMVGYTF